MIERGLRLRPDGERAETSGAAVGSELYLGSSRCARPLPRGVTGHVAHPIRSIEKDYRFEIQCPQITQIFTD
jgi:hypothetical protein